MTSYAAGSSSSWQKTKSRARTLADEHNDAKGYPRMSVIDEEAVCNMEYFNSFSEWLVEEYHQANGKGLIWSTVVSYFQIVLQDAVSRFSTLGTDKTKLFLSCCKGGGNADMTLWLRKVKVKIQRVITERMTKAGEVLDGSESPIYLSVLMKVNTAYAKVGTAEANMRKFVLTTSQRAVARAGEVSLYSKHITLYVDVFQLSICDFSQPNKTRFFHK
jgi:hypothetical protein